MRTTIRFRLLGILVLTVFGGAMLADLPAAQNAPNKTAPKKDAKKKSPYDRLPITQVWELEELVKLGPIVQTRNEAATKNRIVWVLEVQKLPKGLELEAVLCDDDGGVRYRGDKLELKALKKAPGAKVTRLEVIMKMPPKEEQEGVFKAVIRKVE